MDRVSPDDEYDILVYHRWISGAPKDDDDSSWGRGKVRKHDNTIRMVVLLDRAKYTEDYINKVIDAMPDIIDDSAGVDMYSAEVGQEISLIVDQDSVGEQEFGEMWKDKYLPKFYIFAVEYSLQFVQCSTCDTSSVI